MIRTAESRMNYYLSLSQQIITVVSTATQQHQSQAITLAAQLVNKIIRIGYSGTITSLDDHNSQPSDSVASVWLQHRTTNMQCLVLLLQGLQDTQRETLFLTLLNKLHQCKCRSILGDLL